MAGRVSDDELQPEQPEVVEKTATFKPKVLVSEYLLQRLPVYQRLRELQKKASISGHHSPSYANTDNRLYYQGWEDPEAESHFEEQRKRADNPTPKDQTYFFKMMIKIAQELDKKTGVFRYPGPDGFPKAVLDLCMAPGGFSTFALQKNPSVLVRGISLPPSMGGHEIRFDLADGSKADYDWSDSDPGAPIYVDFRDITFLADEMGSPCSGIPASHKDAASFSSDRPFLGQKFDLVFCDGQVLRTHERKECTYWQTLHPHPMRTQTCILLTITPNHTRSRKLRGHASPHLPTRHRTAAHPARRVHGRAPSQSRRLVALGDPHARLFAVL